jgi:hypothetical protein
MAYDAEQHLAEAIELNADQLTASLNAMTDAVYEADRQGNADGGVRKMRWWESFIATQSRINALVEKAQVALQATKEAARETLSRLHNNADVNKWLNRLAGHGVAPFQVKQQNDETVAIVADLVMWKAKDPTYLEKENPWRGVMGIYAKRIIARPTGDQKAKLSRPGTPQPGTRGDPGDYLFSKQMTRRSRAGGL